MPEYVLHDFMTTVPSCFQTDDLAVALNIFKLGQCDRLVVVSEQQCPVGVLYAAHLIAQFRSDTQQPLQTLGVPFVEPIAVLPAELSVEQFEFSLRSQYSTHTGSDWVLVDSSGKYLGFLDCTRVLQFLAFLPTTAHIEGGVEHNVSSNQNRFERRAINSLIQLLELLPWPLMLQTRTGEVVMQNPVWRQQFKALSNPEAVRHEVEEILNVSLETPSQLNAPLKDIGHYLQDIAGEPENHPLAVDHVSFKAREFSSEPIVGKMLSPLLLNSTDALTTIDNITAPPEDHVSSANHCHSGTQPGTCICVWSLENGEERVWQFIKIPLQEYGLKFGHALDAATDNDLWLLAATDVTEQQILASELAAKNADLIQLNRLKD